jgi:hypothetical protein
MRRAYLLLSRNAPVRGFLAAFRESDPDTLRQDGEGLVLRGVPGNEEAALRFQAGPTGWTVGVNLDGGLASSLGLCEGLPVHVIRLLLTGDPASAVTVHAFWSPPRTGGVTRDRRDPYSGLDVSSVYQSPARGPVPATLQIEARSARAVHVPAERVRAFLFQVARLAALADHEVDLVTRALQGPTAEDSHRARR